MCEEAELGSFDLNLASGLNFFFFFFAAPRKNTLHRACSWVCVQGITTSGTVRWIFCDAKDRTQVVLLQGSRFCHPSPGSESFFLKCTVECLLWALTCKETQNCRGRVDCSGCLPFLLRRALECFFLVSVMCCVKILYLCTFEETPES